MSVAERIAVSDLENNISRECNITAEKVLSEYGTNIQSAISESYDNEGKTASLSSDFSRLNMIKTKLADEITAKAGKAHTISCRVPSGTLFSDGILAGCGFDIPLRFIVTGTGFVDFAVDFTSTGINQSRYTININITVDAEVHTLFGSCPKRVVVSIPLAEKIIVGDTPAGIIDTGQISVDY